MPGWVFPSSPSYTMCPLGKPPETERMPRTEHRVGHSFLPGTTYSVAA